MKIVYCFNEIENVWYNLIFQCQGLDINFLRKVFWKLSKNKIKINSFIINPFSDVFHFNCIKKLFYLKMKKKGKLNIEFSVSHFKQIVWTLIVFPIYISHPSTNYKRWIQQTLGSECWMSFLCIQTKSLKLSAK